MKPLVPAQVGTGKTAVAGFNFASGNNQHAAQQGRSQSGKNRHGFFPFKTALQLTNRHAQFGGQLQVVESVQRGLGALGREQNPVDTFFQFFVYGQLPAQRRIDQFIEQSR